MTETTTPGTTGDSCPPPPPPPPDPSAILREMKLAAVRAALLKPVGAATEDLFSTDPAKQKARAAAQAAYEKAAGKAPKGKLRLDHEGAGRSLKALAKAMEPRLQAWIAEWLAAGKPLHALLDARKKAAEAAKPVGGVRELNRDSKAAETGKWATAHGAWSAPETRIDLKYISEIPKLYDDVNDEAYSTYRFWFEIVPKQLQYSGATIAEGDLKGLAAIRDAVKAFPDVAAAFVAGADRQDGSVYLIDPADLLGHRKWIRQKWEDAAKAQAEAEVDYQMDPDDHASRTKARDQLDKQYGEDVRAAMPPTQPS